MIRSEYTIPYLIQRYLVDYVLTVFVVFMFAEQWIRDCKRFSCRTFNIMFHDILRGSEYLVIG